MTENQVILLVCSIIYVLVGLYRSIITWILSKDIILEMTEENGREYFIIKFPPIYKFVYPEVLLNSVKYGLNKRRIPRCLAPFHWPWPQHVGEKLIWKRDKEDHFMIGILLGGLGFALDILSYVILLLQQFFVGDKTPKSST